MTTMLNFLLAAPPAALEPLALQGNYRLAAAILFGMLLGLALAKTGLLDRVAVKDALTLKDLTLVKTVILAMGAGMLIFCLLRQAHMVQAHVPEMTFWGALLGGVIAGVGLGIGGLVPVTAAAALGAGRFYAVWVLIGMLLAIPTVKMAKAQLGTLIERFSAPMESSLEPGNGLWALDSPVLWICGICVVLCGILHFCGPSAK